MVAHNRVEATPDMQPLLDRVIRGEQLTITRDGVVVAVLQPVQGRVRDEAEARDLARRFRELARGNSLGDLKIKDLINEGRR